MNNTPRMNAQGDRTQLANNTASLQSYITELTVYINQNNQKYTRNLQTLKQFYEDQINQLNDSLVSLDQVILGNKNEIITLKDLLQNKKTQNSLLNEKIDELKLEIQQTNNKVTQEKQKNQRVYQQMDQLRQNMQQSIDTQVERSRNAERKISELQIQLKEKQLQIQRLQNEKKQLEQKLAERYSMPQRMKQMQIQSAKDNLTINNLKQRISLLTKQKDFSQTQLQKKRRENQKFRIEANKAKGDLSFQIQKAIKGEREKLNSQIQNLKMQNQRKIYQIKDLQMKLKQKSQTSQKLENITNQLSEQKSKLQKQLKQYRDDKQIYLDEFRKLKGQYQQVINNLQQAIPQYQKKNWSLQQQNQDLNTQLDGLQELLRELRAMNDMEPARKQYRQWAQLNLLADKKLPQQKAPDLKNDPRFIIRTNEVDISPDWQNLMKQIDKIQI